MDFLSACWKHWFILRQLGHFDSEPELLYVNSWTCLYTVYRTFLCCSFNIASIWRSAYDQYKFQETILQFLIHQSYEVFFKSPTSSVGRAGSWVRAPCRASPLWKTGFNTVDKKRAMKRSPTPPHFAPSTNADTAYDLALRPTTWDTPRHYGTSSGQPGWRRHQGKDRMANHQQSQRRRTPGSRPQPQNFDGRFPDRGAETGPPNACRQPVTLFKWGRSVQKCKPN